jgi:hypothetical protein
MTRYAEQTLASDALSLGLVLGGHGADHELVRDAGIGLHLGGAPLVHLAHGNGRAAAGSLALRITLPLAASWLGSKLATRRCSTAPGAAGAAESSCDDDRMQPGALVGLALGMAAASVIDATTLAKKKRWSHNWRPDIRFKDGGMRVGIQFKF